MKQVFKLASFFRFPIVIFLVHSLVKSLGLYDLYPNVDIVSHFLGGLSIAYTASQILSFFEAAQITTTRNRLFFGVFILSLTATAAVSWEFAEFLSDQLLNTHLQPSIANTMQDQFLGIAGGCVWSMIYLIKKF